MEIGNQIFVTWMGNASLKIESETTCVLIDPFVEFAGGENPNKPEDFIGADAILLTHGHADHIGSLPDILTIEVMPVYCTKTPADTLSYLTKTMSCHNEVVRNTHVISPGMTFAIGDMTVRIHPGRHIRFDNKLLLKTFTSPNMLKYRKNLMRFAWLNFNCPENIETVLIEIEAYGKRVQIVGSLGLDPSYEYNQDADAFMMAYQGNSNLPDLVRPVLKALRPKKVILTHFDNAFPPLSSSVDTRGVKEMTEEEFPEIQVIKPEIGVRIMI